ncbi:MAG: acyltransferase family protein [Clostridiales bacterium]|nr:acyltransferase family protein [Clostridiales bacterium]
MHSSRIPEIDIAKGFAIFLVILGHIVTIHHTLFRWIFSFHMPVFFFLSGMTFRPERYHCIRDYISAKGRRLILPYLIITFAAFLICMARPDYRLPVITDGWRHQLKWIFWYAQPQNLYVGQIWFLVALFMAELISLLWIRFLGDKSICIRLFSLLALGLAGVSIRMIFPYLPVGERLPWKLDTALTASVFVIAGYYAGRTNLPERLAPLSSFLIPVSIWLSFYFGPMLSSYVNICDCAYDAAPYYYTAAFLGIAALVLTAYLGRHSCLARFRRFWGFWQFCGRYSMPIFVGQTFVIYFLVETIERFTGIRLHPMDVMPNNLASLALAAATLALMLAFIWPWSQWKGRKRDQTDVLP